MNCELGHMRGKIGHRGIGEGQRGSNLQQTLSSDWSSQSCLMSHRSLAITHCPPVAHGSVPEIYGDWIYFNPFHTGNPKVVFAKSADPDQMPHDVASDQGLHYFASSSAIYQQKYLN